MWKIECGKALIDFAKITFGAGIIGVFIDKDNPTNLMRFLLVFTCIMSFGLGVLIIKKWEK